MPQSLTYAIGIPARFDSSRFPGKPLALLAGKPMLAHVIERALAANIGQVIVATDHQGIADVALHHGASVQMTRSDHQSGSDRLAEAMADIDCDVVINVRGDEPLIDPSAICAVVSPFATQNALQMATLAHPIHEKSDFTDPNVVKVVRNAKGNAMYFSRASIPYARQQEDVQGSEQLQHIGLYAYKKDFLLQYSSLEPCPSEQTEQLEQLRVLHHGYPIAVTVGDFRCLGVDTPDDLQRAEALLKKI